MFEFEKHLQTFALPAAVCCCPMVCTMLHSFVLLRRLIEKLLKFYNLFITLTTFFNNFLPNIISLRCFIPLNLFKILILDIIVNQTFDKIKPK